MKGKLLILTALVVCLWPASAQAKVTSNCTLREIDLLQIEMQNVPTYFGWVSVPDLLRAKAKACKKVPGRWSYIGNDFLRSTRMIDRVWYGIGSWEKNCARSEGGWGRWVPNRRGSGAGGWLQFMSGTFYGVIDKAFASAYSEGLRPPRWAASWYSPLGQALAGAQMIFDNRRGEWQGDTC